MSKPDLKVLEEDSTTVEDLPPTLTFTFDRHSGGYGTELINIEGIKISDVLLALEGFKFHLLSENEKTELK